MLFISFVGLKGAIPITLASLYQLESMKQTGSLISFFIVLTSALIQDGH